MEEARAVFSDTNINITAVGKKYLGGLIGREDVRNNYFKDLVDDWISEINMLCSEPQAAYSAFIHGFQHKLTYHIRTIPSVSQLLVPLDDGITNKLIPALKDGHICNDLERVLLGLPIRMGGLGVPIFSNICDREYGNFASASKQLSSNILDQISHLQFLLGHTTIPKITSLRSD